MMLELTVTPYVEMQEMRSQTSKQYKITNSLRNQTACTSPRPPHAEIAQALPESRPSKKCHLLHSLENDDKEKRTFEKKSAKRVGRNDDSNADASDSASPKRKAFRSFQKPFYLSESPFCVRERSIGMCSET
ncbi:hypothetical protein BB8028_0005g02790 [Beauveria bassiana]|uniref:Uncharacterized protein n=1 Tax=Beauveria bassiana TaxID=176275 RepID=A0A2S7YEY2_BEABA|nr:hypothetical protein BB8028_0005g02790 [Beauveria bassiana]